MTNPNDDEMDLLIAYALDDLAPGEDERVRRLLAERPELHATVSELRATLDRLPHALPESDIPPELRMRALSFATGWHERHAATPPAGGAWRRLTLALGGLSGALALAAALLWGQLGDAQRQLAQAQVQLQQALAERDQIVQAVSSAEVLAELKGERGRATVLRTPAGDTLLAAQLPPLAQGRVYQLWTIEGQDAPVSAGVFQVGEDGSALVTLRPGEQAPGTVFAVTDEPGPAGSAGPTSDPLIAGSMRV